MNIQSDLANRVRNRQDSLTKPQGSLGRLEDIALRFALIRGEEMPTSNRKAMYVFCADHGVTAERISLFPSEVTQQMVRNYLTGGAAITVLCRQFDITPVVVDCGVLGEPVPGVIDRKIAQGTANFATGQAMSREQAEQALAIGRELAEDAATNYDLCGVGEMGIGNTTAAAAIFCAIAGVSPTDAAGPGTGLDERGVRHKAEVIERALATHKPDASDPIGVLAAVGGFEIGAIAGFIAAASELRLPVVIDGFITCAGALLARALSPSALDTAFFAHKSAERGHAQMLQVMGAEPLLDLGMRLGEGTGAALAMNLIESGMRLYREMATFAEAQVSGGDAPVR